IQARPDRNLAVEVTGFYSDLPLSGYAPLRVRIQNQGKLPRTFSLSTESSNAYEGGMRVTYDTKFTVEPGERRQLEIMAPLATMGDNSYLNPQLRVYLNGNDIRNSSGSQETQHRKADHSKPMAPYMALSKRIS